jgi:RNA polymerase sigma-70 factor, ECF subfamily
MWVVGMQTGTHERQKATHVKAENGLLDQNGDTHLTPADSDGYQDALPRTEAMVDLEQVFSRYIGPVYGFLYARVGNREDAEDLASETFLKASRQLDMERSEASIVRWLFTVAGTVLADHWRKYYRCGTVLPVDEFHLNAVTGTATTAAEQSERERRIASILEALPERYRRVLQLRFLGGFSVLETAQELGVTPGNAKVLQYRALARAAQVASGLPPSSTRS